MWHTGSKTIFGINVEQTISQFWSEKKKLLQIEYFS